MSDYGRGEGPDWRPGQGAPGYGPPGSPPPGQDGQGYGPGQYGAQQGGYAGQPPQGPPPYGPPPYGQPPGGRGAPTTTMPAGGPPPDWPGPGQQQPQPGYGGQGSGYGPAQPPPGYQAPPRRKGPIIIAVVAVLAVVVGGGLGLYFWLNNGRGGAETPVAAVRLLANDLASDNYLDAFSRLHPAEATLFTDANSVITDELERLEILKPGADLGIGSIQISDLVVDDAAAEQVRENVVINKVTGGTITFDQSDLPFTDAFAQRAFPNGMAPAGQPTVVNLADEVNRTGEPIRLASVQVDGEWYVSLFYTAADYILQDEGLAWPTTSVPANGAVTPEDALKETVQAALDGDVNRLVELADPSELQVIHDLGPTIIAESGGGEPTGARLVELDTTESDVRGHTGLGLDRVVVEADGQQVTVERAGDCVNVTVDGSAQQFCSADLVNLVGETGDPTLQRVLPRLVDALLDVQVITTEVDGKHYVSPGQTLISFYATGLGALEPQDILELLDAMN